MPAVEVAMVVLLVIVGVMLVTGAFARVSYWLMVTVPALAPVG